MIISEANTARYTALGDYMYLQTLVEETEKTIDSNRINIGSTNVDMKKMLTDLHDVLECAMAGWFGSPSDTFNHTNWLCVQRLASMNAHVISIIRDRHQFARNSSIDTLFKILSRLNPQPIETIVRSIQPLLAPFIKV